jgi:hypothetical protein
MCINILIAIFTAFAISLKAQFIIAGQPAATDYYADILDTTLHYNPFSQPTLPLDINGDGNIDFDLTIKYAQSQASKVNYIVLNPRDSNQTVFNNFDSCSNSGQPPILGGSPIVKSFNANNI